MLQCNYSAVAAKPCRAWGYLADTCLGPLFRSFNCLGSKPYAGVR